MNYLSKTDLELMELMKAQKNERRRLSEIAHELGIPTSVPNNSDPFVTMKDLWAILSDEKKFKDLTSRLKLKAFW